MAHGVEEAAFLMLSQGVVGKTVTGSTTASIYQPQSDSSATRILRNHKKYYIYFIDNLLLFTTVKEFSKFSWVTVDEVIARSSTPRFF